MKGDMAEGGVMVEPPLFQNEFSDSYEWCEGYDSNSFISMLKLGDEMDTWESSRNINCHLNSTAYNKMLAFSVTTGDTSNSAWKQKPVKQWDTNDIMFWSSAVVEECGFNSEEIDLSQFNGLDGGRLCLLTESDFASRDPKLGMILYTALQQQCRQDSQSLTTVIDALPTFLTIKDETENDRVITELAVRRESANNAYHSSDDSDAPSETVTPPKKRPPGRPRIHITGRRGRKTEKKTGRLWEFIRDLLLNREYCPSLICWENHDEGVFRFVRSEKVAQLWGTIKENPKMTYEKLSRAMRYYYRSKVLQPVLGRRLVYKFGPTATGWRTPNPNFRLPG